MKNNKVSIVVLIMEEVKVFEKCLKSVKKYTDNYELIVISNGSSKKTIKFLENIDWIDFTLVKNQKNMGFSYGCNQGIKVAKFEYICLLNSDTIVTPNWLPKLLKCFEINKDCGMVSPTTCFGAPEQVDRSLVEKRFEMTEQNILDYANKLKENYKVSDIYGFCMLTPKSILDRVGVFDHKRYGLINTEEKDLMWRIKQVGYKNYWAQGVYVHHYGHQAMKKVGTDPFETLRRNRAIFEKRKKDSNIFVENDTIIGNIKEIKIKRDKKIDVIIPVLDRKEETIKTLNSLFKNNENINVIIIDNGSNNLSYLEKFDVKIIRNRENRGVIYALNQGLDIAKGEFIVFMHNDVIVNTKDWIHKAIKFMQKSEEIGMVGIAGWNEFGKKGIYTRINLKTAIEKYNRKPDGRFEEVVVLDGVCNVIKNIGLRFDKVYGLIHFHDLDFCMQYREKGYKLYAMNGSATHLAEVRKHSTIANKKYKDLIEKKDKDYWWERNKIFVEKWKDHLPMKLEPIPILMITWNRLEYTKKAIKNLKENTYHPYILWIWDNGSKDGTVKYLKSIKDKNIIVSFRKKNWGLVPPMNAFFNKFKKDKYVAKVDNDTIVSSYWLTKLKNVMDNLPLFVIGSNHYLGLHYKLKNNQEFYDELESIRYRGEKLYLYVHVGGSGILIRRKHIDKPVRIIKGKLSGWTRYQFNKCRTENLRCAFYTEVWADRLDFVATNKFKSDYPEYSKIINKMRSGNEKDAGFGSIDIDLKHLKKVRESMRVPWGGFEDLSKGKSLKSEMLKGKFVYVKNIAPFDVERGGQVFKKDKITLVYLPINLEIKACSHLVIVKGGN